MALVHMLGNLSDRVCIHVCVFHMHSMHVHTVQTSNGRPGKRMCMAMLYINYAVSGILHFFRSPVRDYFQ